jgi:hypothetical protein
MGPNAIPTRITIDFRDTAMPSRTWILGVDEGAPDRLELIAFEGRDLAPYPAGRPRRSLRSAGPAAALVAECACPDFCERDHANE